jgi:hypothetical protein
MTVCASQTSLIQSAFILTHQAPAFNRKGLEAGKSGGKISGTKPELFYRFFIYRTCFVVKWWE